MSPAARSSNVPAAAANPWMPQTVRIAAIDAEIEGVSTYALAFTSKAAARRYRFAPGQFNMLYLPGVGEIAISLSADPAAKGAWAHTIRAAGGVTRVLSSLEPGATLGLRGPFGSSWPLDECRHHDIVVVAGGIGLAPLRPAILSLLARPRNYGRLTMLYGARSPDTLLYAASFDDWQQRGLSVQTTVDRAAPGWHGNVGVVTLLVERLMPFDAGNTVVLICGPEVMMRYTVRAAIERGMAPDRIWVSMERNMQCAVGLCGHCQLGGEFVCKDGPVFRYDRVAPYLAVKGL